MNDVSTQVSSPTQHYDPLTVLPRTTTKLTALQSQPILPIGTHS